MTTLRDAVALAESQLALGLPVHHLAALTILTAARKVLDAEGAEPAKLADELSHALTPLFDAGWQNVHTRFDHETGQESYWSEEDASIAADLNRAAEVTARAEAVLRAQDVAAAGVPREPTPAMSAAGFVVPEAEHDPAGVWRAMHDAYTGRGKP